ncbi:nitric oxide synthase oxygenase [Paenibacillus sp. Marseille-Q4541]|uniref:nitric oxide synthase oxygenase n=1 Tax=Paenibacillus sp. Marseille-Q4541 TaxID=2831522 RepID=UPI001BA68219|nr:nitric oxide synthase oxygenase [Paenibacillus sp. Marseille-Q4541]
MTNTTEIWEEAKTFIYTCYEELGLRREAAEARLLDVRQQIDQSGTYEHTVQELEYGIKLAWRNSNRCIGRLFWQSIRLVDARDATTAEEVAHYLIQHIRAATNNGKVIPMLTLFAPSNSEGQDPVRIWNHQLIRYAGYEKGTGIVGDPASVSFTKQVMKLGWKGKGSAYDVLPLVIEMAGQAPVYVPIPEELVMEVAIEHPEYSAMRELGMKWYAVPMISDMKLEIGGIVYPAAPFNGWYMGTEIGARNLADTFRYNMLPEVARVMQLDTRSEASLWRDKALVELNVAVLHSFRKHGVSIVDHHTAANQLARFEEREAEAGREVTGNWTWLIPPLSPATTHIFHKPYHNKVNKPNFFHQKAPYTEDSEIEAMNGAHEEEKEAAPVAGKCPFHS